MIIVSVDNSFFSLVIMPFSRRTNELKSEIDISDELIEKFKNFWSHFKDTPLKGKKKLTVNNFSAYCVVLYGRFLLKLMLNVFGFDQVREKCYLTRYLPSSCWSLHC